MPKEVERLLGKRIALMRKERGFSQAQLAEAIDVAPETISRLERGVSVPSVSTLEDIVEALNITLKDIFEFHIPPKKQTPSDRDIARIISLLKMRKPLEIQMAHSILKDVFRAMEKLS